MPQIISGAQQDANGPYLQGLQFGQAIRKNREAEEKSQLAMAEFNQEQAKVAAKEKEALQRHQQGSRDAEALATWGSLMHRAKMDPKLAEKWQRGERAQKAIQGLAQRGVSYDAIKDILGQIEKNESTIEEHEQQQATEEGIQRAAQDGYISEQDQQSYMLRSKSGEKGVLKEIEDKRQEGSVKQAIVQANEEELQRAESFVQSLPPGPERDMARARVNYLSTNSKEMETKGSGAKVMLDIQEIAIKGKREPLVQDPFADPKQRAYAIKQAEMDARANESSDAPYVSPDEEAIRQKMQQINPALQSPFAGLRQPPPIGFNPQQEGPVNEEASMPRNDELSKAIGSGDPKAIVEAMKRNGIPFTRESQKAIRALLESRRVSK